MHLISICLTYEIEFEKNVHCRLSGRVRVSGKITLSPITPHSLTWQHGAPALHVILLKLQ